MKKGEISSYKEKSQAYDVKTDLNNLHGCKV